MYILVYLSPRCVSHRSLDKNSPRRSLRDLQYLQFISRKYSFTYHYNHVNIKCMMAPPTSVAKIRRPNETNSCAVPSMRVKDPLALTAMLCALLVFENVH